MARSVFSSNATRGCERQSKASRSMHAMAMVSEFA